MIGPAFILEDEKNSILSIEIKISNNSDDFEPREQNMIRTVFWVWKIKINILMTEIWKMKTIRDTRGAVSSEEEEPVAELPAWLPVKVLTDLVGELKVRESWGW